ncbi:LapA family protein [Yoonia sp. R2331]|uniref:LapA family protein n=1 Tax=Yoonia sp. R2331 TaxID=3237238 RepID=UPI0034E3ED15
MKTLRYGFWAIVGLCLIIVGLGNRGEVTVHAMPTPLADLLRISPDVSLPLFVVIFISVGVGLLIGFLWEWVREFRIRSDARAKAREVAALRKEVADLRAKSASPEKGDDVLALLDAPAR